MRRTTMRFQWATAASLGLLLLLAVTAAARPQGSLQPAAGPPLLSEQAASAQASLQRSVPDPHVPEPLTEHADAPTAPAPVRRRVVRAAAAAAAAAALAAHGEQEHPAMLEHNAAHAARTRHVDANGAQDAAGGQGDSRAGSVVGPLLVPQPSPPPSDFGRMVAASYAFLRANRTDWHLDMVRKTMDQAEEIEHVYKDAARGLAEQVAQKKAEIGSDPARQGELGLTTLMVGGARENFIQGKDMIAWLTKDLVRGRSPNLPRLVRVQSIPLEPTPQRPVQGVRVAPVLKAAYQAKMRQLGATHGTVTYQLDKRGRVVKVSGFTIAGKAAPPSVPNAFPLPYMQSLLAIGAPELSFYNSHDDHAAAGPWVQAYFFPPAAGGSIFNPLNLFPQRLYTRTRGRWAQAEQLAQLYRSSLKCTATAAPQLNAPGRPASGGASPLTGPCIPQRNCIRIDHELHYNSARNTTLDVDARAVIPNWGLFSVAVRPECLSRSFNWEGVTRLEGGFRVFTANWTQDEEDDYLPPHKLPTPL